MKIENMSARVAGRRTGETGLIGRAALATLAALTVGCGGASLVGDGTPDNVSVTAGPTSGLAVVGGDFTSSIISLLKPDGTLAQDDCLDSGTAPSGKLSLALSGDVTLPSQPQAGGKLWIVDRGNAALTVLEPTTCAVTAQLAVGTGFKANPHDVVILSDTKAYVTRYEKDHAATATLAAGDDIVIFNPTTGALAGRIDLSGQASPVAGKAIQARPDRMVIAAGKVFVTLGNQDAKFSAAGEGAVVVIDPATDLVAARVALTGLKGCEGLTAVEDGKKLFVACGGSFADVDQAAGSGIAVIDVGVWPPAVAGVIKAAALDGHAVNFSWVGALSATRVLASTLGSFGDAKSNTPATKDAVFSIDVVAGTSAPFGLEGDAFDLGRAAVGASTAFVPDASSTSNTPRVRAFSVPATGVAAETAAVDADPAKKLPPREVAWY